MLQQTPLLFSVVICTCNRADLLRCAVQSVLEQNVPPDLYEIIIIDNSSTDTTPFVARQFQQMDSRVHCIIESKVGLSYARNRGMQEARGEYVAYLDDDCKVPATWLSAAQKVVAENKPEAFGGPYYPFYNAPKPFWYKDEYGSYIPGETSRPLSFNEYLIGLNMFIRSDVLKKMGGFNTTLGMKGKTIAYGEETDLFHRMRADMQGVVIYYSPEVFVYHLVRSNKLVLREKFRMMFIAGCYHSKIWKPKSPSASFSLIKIMLQIIRSITWDALCRDRKRYPFFQNYLYESSSALFHELGYYYEHLFQRIS